VKRKLFRFGKPERVTNSGSNVMYARKPERVTNSGSNVMYAMWFHNECVNYEYEEEAEDKELTTFKAFSRAFQVLGPGM